MLSYYISIFVSINHKFICRTFKFYFVRRIYYKRSRNPNDFIVDRISLYSHLFGKRSFEDLTSPLNQLIEGKLGLKQLLTESVLLFFIHVPLIQSSCFVILQIDIKKNLIRTEITKFYHCNLN